MNKANKSLIFRPMFFYLVKKHNIGSKELSIILNIHHSNAINLNKGKHKLNDYYINKLLNHLGYDIYLVKREGNVDTKVLPE